jgi:hypothetical protein
MKKWSGLPIVAALAVAAQPASARWVEVKTQHFVLYGDLSDREAAGYA